MSLAHVGLPELEARAVHERALTHQTEDDSLVYEETPVVAPTHDETVPVSSPTQQEAADRTKAAVRKFIEISDRRTTVAKDGPESRFPRVEKVVDKILGGVVKVFEIHANALTKTPPHQDHDDDRHKFSR